MEETLTQDIHDKLDQLITDHVGQFPDGEDFVTELEVYLQSLVMDESIDSWALRPHSSEGFKVLLEKDGELVEIIRNSDGGKQ